MTAGYADACAHDDRCATGAADVLADDRGKDLELGDVLGGGGGRALAAARARAADAGGLICAAGVGVDAGLCAGAAGAVAVVVFLVDLGFFAEGLGLVPGFLFDLA